MACLVGCGSSPQKVVPASDGFIQPQRMTQKQSLTKGRATEAKTISVAPSYAGVEDTTDVTGSVVPKKRSPSTSSPSDPKAVKPFTPEWWAIEKARDDELKKSISICKGC